jgi:zeta-carotene desaturase
VKPVVIAGAGLSGLAAGVFLSRRGIPVVLYEQKPFAGGRAYSFADPGTGETVDNGQHVMIAGYDATMRLLDVIGSRHLVRVQEKPRLLFHHPERGFRAVTLPPLPSPFHLAAGILRSDLLEMADRLRLLRAGLTFLRPGRSMKESSLTVEEWLDRAGQNSETRQSFWEPLAIAIMNEHCATASALLFTRSLRKAFFDRWDSAAFAVSQVGLSRLFAEPAIEYIEHRGGRVVTGNGVMRVVEQDGSATGVCLGDGTVVDAGAVVLAVPPYRVRDLLPETLRSGGYLAGVEHMPFTSILSLHLWFPEDFMGHEDIVGIIGRRIQWIFNRRSINLSSHGNSPKVASGYICAVISAAQKFIGLSKEELVAIALEDLRAVYGRPLPEPTASLALREKRATFSSAPATEPLRPGPQTPLRNLFLAGDWTATGYPATIEGAIVSAERCTALI